MRGYVLGIAVLWCGVALADAWLPVGSEAHGFVALLPGSATEAEETHWTLAGPVHSRSWEFRGTETYRVEVHRLPRLARAFTSEAGLLAQAGRAVVADAAGEELGVGASQLAGRPAREITWRNGDGRLGKARLLLVDDRLFVVQTVHTGGEAGEERFFASFEAW
ncbi:MAG: hypothetical protein VX546_05675 [Myxococcota bacterium]|nr:hypothetical protein [Myxococcota bacterium]